MDLAVLQRRNRRLAAAHETLIDVAGDLVIVLQEAVAEIQCADVCIRRQEWRRPLIHLPVDAGEYETDAAAAAAEVLGGAHDGVIRGRFVSGIARTRSA